MWISYRCQLRQFHQIIGGCAYNKRHRYRYNNKHVLIVEDLVDTGLTLHYLKSMFEARGPKDVKICTALDKPSRRKVDLEIDYKGITIPDKFVVGYGLDYAEKYRNLPDVCVLDSSVYTDKEDMD